MKMLVAGTVAGQALLATLFPCARFDAVLHFASLIQVGESVTDLKGEMGERQRGWWPQREGLTTVIASAWAWE